MFRDESQYPPVCMRIMEQKTVKLVTPARYKNKEGVMVEVNGGGRKRSVMMSSACETRTNLVSLVKKNRYPIIGLNKISRSAKE